MHYEAIQITNCIKYQSLSIHHFNILLHEMGSTNMQKALLLQTEVWWLSQGEALARLFDLWSELAIFFREYHSYLNQWRTVFIKTWVFARHFLNNKLREDDQFKEGNWQSGCQWENSRFEDEIRILEKWCKLDSFPILKDFWGD